MKTLYFCSTETTGTTYGEGAIAITIVMSGAAADELAKYYATVVTKDFEDDAAAAAADNPYASVIDLTGEAPAVREKNDAEKFIDLKVAALVALDMKTQRVIYDIADPDTQNSISLMYQNMSTTDKGRAKTYIDWHKTVLAKHYELKASISAATDAAAIYALMGDDEQFAAQFADIITAAPTSAVDLSSYIH